jgi:hypothetical protein
LNENKNYFGVYLDIISQNGEKDIENEPLRILMKFRINEVIEFLNSKIDSDQ